MGGGIENFIRSLARMSAPKFLLLLLGIGFFYYLYLYDNGAKYDGQRTRLREELVKEEQIAEQTRALEAEKADIIQGRNDLALKFRDSMKALPTEIDVAELIRGINSTAKSAGTKINSIRPARIQELEFFDQLPIDIEAEGSFGELALFLSYIARMPRIVRIQTFTIKGQNRRNSKSNNLILSGELVGFRSRPFEKKKQDGKGKRRRRR